MSKQSDFVGIGREIEKCKPGNRRSVVWFCHYRPIYEGSTESPEYDTLQALKEAYKHLSKVKKGVIVLYMSSTELPPGWLNWFDDKPLPPIKGYTIIRDESDGFKEKICRPINDKGNAANGC